MFTGIIEAVGEIASITPKSGDVELIIKCHDLYLGDVELGDSIAVNGVCLTAVHKTADTFRADVSNETLAKSTLAEAQVGSTVNLEKALRLGDRLGGHLVSGHVDGVGKVTSRSQDSRSWRFEIAPPKNLLKYIAAKGSITINGISLTVNNVVNERFDVNIVPHTLQCTTMQNLAEGDPVNLEIDVLARYLEQLMKHSDQKPSGVSKDLLQKSGYLD